LVRGHYKGRKAGGASFAFWILRSGPRLRFGDPKFKNEMWWAISDMPEWRASISSANGAHPSKKSFFDGVGSVCRVGSQEPVVWI
jgi:hypothetical protein